MNDKYHIPDNYVIPLLTAAAQEGCDIEKLSRDTGIAINPLSEKGSELAVSESQFHQLYRMISDQSQAEATELSSSYRLKPGAFREMALNLIASSDLKKALIRAHEFLLEQDLSQDHP